MIEKHYPKKKWNDLPDDIKNYIKVALSEQAKIDVTVIHGYRQESGENFSTLSLVIESNAHYDKYHNENL